MRVTRTTFPPELTLGRIQIRTAALSREKVLPRIVLAGIVLLAAVLRFANLAALGYVNHYYTAAVASMLKSWHNFFFVAAEPGGSVSVDKPPVGLWLQTISAYFFGVNSFAVVLPQIIAGLISVIVVYHLVRRSFGTVAGLVAALALAITPVVVATDRNNTIDSTLILTLLVAAWAFIKATETSKLRYLLLGVTLVGVGFNIKMLEAYLPLPAFYALYFLGARESLWRKVPKLALASTVLAVVSLSWAVAVDLTPASQRPYVGSSGDNSELSLAIGYNGVERLLGMGGRGGLLSSLFGGSQNGTNRGFQQPTQNGTPPRQGTNNGFSPQNRDDGFRQADGNGGFLQPGADGGTPLQGANGPFPDGAQGARNGFGGGFTGGFDGTGRAGLLRLFSVPLSKEASWLLPFGLFGTTIAIFRTRPRWPISPNHQAIVLWGGWLLAAGVFFSVAGFFHQYYLSTMGAPLAALVGISVVTLWRFWGQHRWLATALLLVAAGVTLWFQFNTARAFVSRAWWFPVATGLFGAGAAWLVMATSRTLRRNAMAACTCLIAALLVTPGIWSGLTTLNSSENQSLPAAYSGQASGPANRGGLQINQALLSYLEANTQGIKYLMAVPSSMQGADYVLATGRPVLYLGGFMGQDKVVTSDDLSRLVANGALRYIYWNGNERGGMGGQADISAWVSANCTPVSGFDTQTRNAGAPDGTTTGTSDGQAFGPGGMQVTLYACGGAKP